MTIKERAKNTIDWEWRDGCIYNFSFKDGYIKGATEQKEIDINTAMWAFWEVVSPYFPDKDIAEEVSDRFLKIMMRQL